MTCVLISFLSFGELAEGQVSAGMPSFSAYDSHDVDTVNLLNNNIFLSIPVMSKSGAFPVEYSLKGNSYVYAGSTWQARLSLFNSIMGSANGVISDTGTTASSTVTQSASCPGGGSTTKFMNWVVVFADGTVHPLPVTDYTDTYGSGLSCLNASFTDTTIDGSGYTVSVTQNTVNSIYDRTGASITLSSFTDSNGNVVSRSEVSHIITDTLGQSVITAVQDSWPANTYTWTDVNWGSPRVTGTSTGSITLQSAFGCTGINDYNLTGQIMQSGATFPDGTSWGITYEGTPGHSGHYTGRVHVITLREGGTVTYTYGGGTHNGIDCTYQTVPVLTRVTSDGTTTYTLTHSLISGSNYKATNTVVDNGGNTTVYTFTGLTSTGNAALPVTQALTEVQHYQGSSTLLTTDVYCYNKIFADCSFTGAVTATVTLPITKLVVMHQINGMSTISGTETRYDGYGNVTYSALFDFGALTSTRATATTYGTWNGTNCVSIGNNVNNKPCDVITTQGGGYIVAESHFTYDSHGNLTKTSVWNGSSWLGQTTANTYNSNGTANTTYDVANNATSYAYASSSYTYCGSCTSYPFPTSITKGGLTTYATWNGTGGVKLTGKDASGNVTTYGYVNSSGAADPFWRVSSVTDPLGNVTYTNYTAATLNNTLSFGSSVKNTTTTRDGYGRRTNVQTQQAPSSLNYDTTSASYGWSGNYKTVNTAAPCTTTSGNACATAHTDFYDPLGRLYQGVTTSNETVTKTYPQNDVVTTLSPPPAGENNKSTQKEYDGLGRLVKLCQILSSGGSACNQNTGTSSGNLTSYAYSSFAGGTQVQVTRGSQTRTKKYDGLGRMTSSTTPEGGTITYAYDTFPPGTNPECVGGISSYPGQLVLQTFASGNVLCYTYDALGRVTNVGGAYSGSPNTLTTCRRYRYDNTSNSALTQPPGSTISNIAGRMFEAETDNCGSNGLVIYTDEWFSYDARGQMTDFYEKTLHSGGWYHTTASYFANGALNTLGGIPGFTTDTFGVDGEGRPSTAMEGATSVVAGVTFNAAGQPVTINVGASGGDSDNYGYDANTGRMNNWTFTVGATPKSQIGNLTWNPNGTLRTLSITDGFNAGGTQTCNFGTSSVMGYDDLGRLLSDDCGSVWGQAFSYDQYNNITKSGSSSWACVACYDAATNRYNSILYSAISYDNDGNLLKDSFHAYAWDAYGKVISIDSTTCGTNGTCLTYDASGRMVEKSDNSSYTEVLYSPAGKTALMHGQTSVSAYIPLPGGATLYKTGDTNRTFQHKDWLGTARLGSSLVNRAVTLDRAFAPYGEMYANFGATSQLNFTGDTQDSVSGTYDTPNRELNPNQGRWLSPDPAGSGWNLYAYPTNPNSSVDPSGLKDISPSWYLGFGAYNATMASMDAFAAGFDNWINSTFTSVAADNTTSTSSSGATTNSGTSTDSSSGTPAPALCFCPADLTSGVLTGTGAPLPGGISDTNPAVCGGPGVPCSVLPTGGGDYSQGLAADGSWLTNVNNTWTYQVVDSNRDPVSSPMMVTEFVTFLTSNGISFFSSSAPTEYGAFNDQIGWGWSSSYNGFTTPTSVGSLGLQTFVVQMFSGGQPGPMYSLSTLNLQFVSVTGSSLNYGFPRFSVP